MTSITRNTVPFREYRDHCVRVIRRQMPFDDFTFRLRRQRPEHFSGYGRNSPAATLASARG